MSLTPAVAALAAATVLNMPFGTIYAFSVFLKPMEAMLGTSRAEMSFVFALATISLTVGMNLAPRLYRSIAPAPLVILCGLCTTLGLALTASAGGLAQFAIGYGLFFGFGAGVGFIIVQQGVNQAVKGASGLANGYVVSLFPLGAMIAAPLVGWGIEAFGLRPTLAGISVLMFLSAGIAALLLHSAAIGMHDASAPARQVHDPQWSLLLRLAGVHFLAATPGLMVMSHAAGIVIAYGGWTALALGATTLIVGANAAARIGGGWLVDRFGVPHVAVGAHLWSLTGALMLTLWPGPLVALPALAMISMGYGFSSGFVAAGIARYWHRNAFGRVASRIYIAWCFAAVTLPVLAGWLYDRTQGYVAVVMLVAGVNLVGVLLSTTLPSGTRAEAGGGR
jgi:OFA family oxalate/formate antiporter-like MFS transporter